MNTCFSEVNRRFSDIKQEMDIRFEQVNKYCETGR